LARDRQTDEQMDRPVAWSRSRCRERRFNNQLENIFTMFFQLAQCVMKNATTLDSFSSFGRRQNLKLSSIFWCTNRHWNPCRNRSTVLTGETTECSHVTLDIW